MTIPGRRWFLQLILLCLVVVANGVAAQPTVTVFAAASLKTALDEVTAEYHTANQTRVQISYGGSSALARQIRYGAPAQIYISANPAWMDSLQNEGLVDESSRIDLLSNRLVLIGGSKAPRALSLSSQTDLSAALGPDGRLAMALVDAVPAGIYGRTALTSLGLWDGIKDRVAQTDNVRAALRLVAMGETPLGIVYATDAMADPRVQVIDYFAPATHPPIVYPAAILRDGVTDQTRHFFAFLTGHTAAKTFRTHGFEIIGGGQ